MPNCKSARHEIRTVEPALDPRFEAHMARLPVGSEASVVEAAIYLTQCGLDRKFSEVVA